MSQPRPRVVVIGGGYAGAAAAGRMSRKAAVTVINPRPHFVERTRLHQFAVGNHHASGDYRTLLGKGTELLVDTVTRIESRTRTVHLATGDSVGYDYLIYAVGSTATRRATVPGVEEFAYPVAEFEHAERLRHALNTLDAEAVITVVGAGLTGLETAGELAEQGRRVRLVCSGVIGPVLTGRARRATHERLSNLHVEVHENARVVRVGPDELALGDGTVLPSAVTVWTAGFGVPQLARASGFRTDTLGRILTDETLTSIDDDRVIAAGDCAAPSGDPVRMACQSALPMGLTAADTVLSRIAGEEPATLDLGFNGIGISLGRRSGVVQFHERDDTPKDRAFAGRIALSIKDLGLKAAMAGLRVEALRPGTVALPGGGRHPSDTQARTADPAHAATEDSAPFSDTR
ncbi:FAD-dependent oxidoreductase [Rhodococcus sp. (in: high G+C Gram-positive bacteria)]|uniref:NAD(P)/FAD-dependent oxidoreductase n=1 Tax=Rhodococcus sp. TaxID=1831 RepID=UPI0019FCF7A5|nr:FAD-dependent oxidoreductase [Rhodococcus sp. (in: high G+C Gram-positive bacteria)]MBF0661066.1 FAD-dependent oxidoreductase [Rhodococcus sp. (in: high G+C Gram-positive bacteria)]